jgi:26S proteasome regulatory subunit N6
VQSPVRDGEDTKKREESIVELGTLLARTKRTLELRQLIEITRPFLLQLGKAKVSKMLRDLVDMCLRIDQDGELKVCFDHD